MTVVIYRDGVIASDSQLVSRQWGCTCKFEKIGSRNVDGKIYLFGATGETAYSAKFFDWINSDAFLAWLQDRSSSHPQIEPAKSDEIAVGLLFHPDGTCTRWEGNAPCYDVTGPFFAFGTGDMAAYGALLAGSTAIRAAEIACEVDVLTNGPVQYLDRKEILASLDNFKAA
jgi:hypothetical protein